MKSTNPWKCVFLWNVVIFKKSGNHLLLSLCKKGYFLFSTDQFLHLHKMLCTTFVRRHKSQGLLRRHLQGWVYSERWWTRWIASPVFCSDNLNLGSSCLSVCPSVPMRVPQSTNQNQISKQRWRREREQSPWWGASSTLPTQTGW